MWNRNSSFTGGNSMTDNDDNLNVVAWAEKIQERFQSIIGAKPSMEWLKAYHEHHAADISSSTRNNNNSNFNSQSNGNRHPKWKEEEAVLQEMLNTDLRTVLRSKITNNNSNIRSSGDELQHACNVTSNPRTAQTQHKVVTNSEFKCIVQLEEIMDVSKPLESRYILNTKNHNRAKDCWKMALCHGNWVKKDDVQIVAMMASSESVFSSSKSTAGMKLLLHSSITISRGVCILHAGNTVVLGGSVLELQQKQEKIQQYYQQRAHMDSTIRALLPTSLTDNNDNDENGEPQDEHVTSSSSSAQTPVTTTNHPNVSIVSTPIIGANVTQRSNNTNNYDNSINSNADNHNRVPFTNHVTVNANRRNNNNQVQNMYNNNQESSMTSINRQQTSKSSNSYPKNNYKNVVTNIPQPIEIIDDDDDIEVQEVASNNKSSSKSQNSNMIASNNQNFNNSSSSPPMQEKTLSRSQYSNISNPYQQNPSSNRQSNKNCNGITINKVHNPYSNNKATTIHNFNYQSSREDHETAKNETNTNRNTYNQTLPQKQKQALPINNQHDTNPGSREDGTNHSVNSFNIISKNEEIAKTIQPKVTCLQFDEFRNLLIKLTKLTSSQALEHYSEMASSQTFLVPCRVRGKPLDFDIVKNKRDKKKHSKLKKAPPISSKYEKYKYFMIVKLTGSNPTDGTITCQISHEVLLPFLKVPPAELRKISRENKTEANKITLEGGLSLIRKMSTTISCHFKLHLTPEEFFSGSSQRSSDSTILNREVNKPVEVNGYNPVALMLSMDNVETVD